jgi:hypothetical protein
MLDVVEPAVYDLDIFNWQAFCSFCTSKLCELIRGYRSNRSGTSMEYWPSTFVITPINSIPSVSTTVPANVLTF